MLISFFLLLAFLLGLYGKVKGQIFLLIYLAHSAFNRGGFETKKGGRSPPPPHTPQNRQMTELCLSSKISTNSFWPGVEKAGT